MVSDHRSRIQMPAATLGAGGPVVSRIGLGLAALGRPAYITSGREEDLPDRSVAGLRTQTFSMLDAAYAAGVRYVDAARSYGRAEEFLAGWLAERGHPDVIVGSKWGYRYTGDWRLDAPQQEVKEHSLAMFTTQLAQSRALLGDRLTLYQVHSLTLDSGLFTDAPLLAALSGLRAEGVIIGLSASGPHQAETIRRALSVTVDGQQLFTATEVTWNLLEPSAGAAAAEAAAVGWAVLIKEAVANGRLTPAGGPPAPLTALAAARGVTEDAIALAAALAQPWASVVLSGAVTRAQLDENLAALTVGPLPELSLAEDPGAYWAERAARPWH
jgi:aryl-alcohol dehydrogenase-like predicted oxidoreductase